MELTSARMFDADAVRQLLDDSAQVTDAASEFSASAGRLAAAYERTLEDLPTERAAAIQQLEEAVGRRVSAMIEQSSQAITAERSAAILQIGEDLTSRLDAAADRLSADVDARTAEALERAARILTQQQELASASLRTHLAEIDAATGRLADRIALRLLAVIVLGAVAVACVAFAYRRVDARFTAPSRAPPAGG
jgi:hypothetical protein